MSSSRVSTAIMVVNCLLLATSQLAVGQVVEQRVVGADGREVMLGVLTEEGLASPPYNAWYQKGENDYAPDQRVVQQIDLSGFDITVFMGTWCGDSRREVPRLMKILRELSFPSSELSIVGVNRTPEQFKQSPNGEEVGNNIHRVPTVIISRDGAEVGRIVESPVVSLEEDLWAITSGKPYTANYQVVDRLHELINAKGALQVVENAPSIARELQPAAENAAQLRGYGFVHLYRKDYDRAVATFEVNRALFPNDAVVHENLATAYFEQGNYKRARDSAGRALQLQPDNENARKLLTATQRSDRDQERRRGE